jgi:hypothetical protein
MLCTKFAWRGNFAAQKRLIVYRVSIQPRPFRLSFPGLCRALSP